MQYPVFRAKVKIQYGHFYGKKLWDFNKERIKQQANNALILNNELEKLRNYIVQTYYEGLGANVNITKEYLQSKLNDYRNPGAVNDKRNFYKVFDEFLKYRKGQPNCSQAIYEKYITTRNHLKNFQKETNFPVSLDLMNPEFYNKFISYLTNIVKMRNSTAGTNIRILKTFLNYCLDKKYLTNPEFIKSFKVLSEKSTLIALTETDLQKIDIIDLELVPRLAKIRDLFYIQVYTGIRISDLKQINDNIIDLEYNEIRLTTKKNI